MAKRSSDPWVDYPEVSVQVRDLVRVVGVVAPFVLSRNLGYKTRGVAMCLNVGVTPG